MKRRTVLARNLENLYPLVWGQCEIGLRNKLRALDGYEDFSLSCNSIAVLKAIREISFSLESQKYPPLQVYDMGKTLYTMQQSHNQTTSDYLERFKDQVDIIDECGGSIGLSQAMITSLLAQEDPPVDVATASTEQYSKAVEEAKQQ